jgi:hypothetical protein
MSSQLCTSKPFSPARSSIGRYFGSPALVSGYGVSSFPFSHARSVSLSEPLSSSTAERAVGDTTVVAA